MKGLDIILRKLPHRAQIFCVLIGGILIELTLGGFVFSAGNYIPYVLSYLKMKVPGQEHVNYALMIWAPSCADVAFSVGSVFGGYLERKVGLRITSVVGTIISAGGACLTYYSTKVSFWCGVLTNALIGNIGVGIMYNVPLLCVMQWIPRNRGLANGCILVGFALGGGLYSAIETAYVNPENLTPNADGIFTQEAVLSRLPMMFVLIGVTSLILSMVGTCLLISPENGSQLSHNQLTPLLLTDKGCSIPIEEENHPIDGLIEHVPPRQALRSGTFLCLWLTFVLVTPTVKFLSIYYKAFGQTFIENDIALTTIGAVASAMCGVSKIPWGHFGDRYSYQGAMIFMTGLLVIFIGTLCLTPLAGPPLYYVWILILFAVWAGPYPLFPMAVTHAFGFENSGVNNGLFLTSIGATGLLTAVMTTLLMQPLGYCGMFLLLAILAFLGFVITLFIHRTKYGKRIGIRKKNIETVIRDA